MNLRPFLVPPALVVVLVIWVGFLVMQTCGLVLSIFAAPLGQLFGIEKWKRYASNQFHATDCAAAASWGWDGTETISKKCAESDGVLCKVTCWALSHVLEPKHCEKELSPPPPEAPHAGG